MKKTTKRKLVLEREFVKALVTELRHDRLQDARGGVLTFNSLQIVVCSGHCRTVDMEPTG